MAAILSDSVVVAVVVCTRPRAIPLAMITMRKFIHGFPFVSHVIMGLRLAALRAAGAPLSCITINLNDRRFFICVYLKLVLDNQDCITVLISSEIKQLCKLVLGKKLINYSTYNITYFNRSLKIL